MTDVLCTSETSVYFNKTTWDCVPEGSYLQIIGWLMNNKWDGIWKGAATVYYNILKFTAGIKTNHKKDSV
jgi:hypothetical protein